MDAPLAGPLAVAVRGARAAEWQAEGRSALFGHLKSFLTAERDAVSQAATATALGMNEGAVRVAVHRLRKRYRQLLRDEVAQTLTYPTQVEEEMRALFDAFHR